MDHIDPARPIAAGWAARLVETNANQPPTMLEPELPKTSRPCRPTSGRNRSSCAAAPAGEAARPRDGCHGGEVDGRLGDQPGTDLIKYGTSRFDDTLVRDHLIDEFRFWIMPVVAGAGQRLFEDVDTCGLDLRLTDERRLGSPSASITGRLPRQAAGLGSKLCDCVFDLAG